MRNLKKFLALVLAMMMAFSLMVTVNAADTSFTDGVNEKFAEAVDVLNGMGVFKGYEDGTFKPQTNISRAEVAAIVYRLATGDAGEKQTHLYVDGATKFDDVKADDWFAGVVGYCANNQLVLGYNDTHFGPQDNVTGVQALAMILRAVGYGQAGEFKGGDWATNVYGRARSENLLKNVDSTSYASKLSQPATRELVAELLFRAANIPTVTWTQALGYNKYTTSLTTGNADPTNFNKSLGQKNFGLTSAVGVIVGNQATGEETTLVGKAGTLSAPDKDDSTKTATYGYTAYDYPGTEVAVGKFTGGEPAAAGKIPAGLSLDAKTGLDLFGHEVKVWYNGAKHAYAVIDQATHVATVYAGDGVLSVASPDGTNDKLAVAAKAAGFSVQPDSAKDGASKAYVSDRYSRIDTDAAANVPDDNKSPVSMYALISNNDDKTVDVVIALSAEVAEIYTKDTTAKDKNLTLGNDDETESTFGKSKDGKILLDQLTPDSVDALGALVTAWEVVGTTDTLEELKKDDNRGAYSYQLDELKDKVTGTVSTYKLGKDADADNVVEVVLGGETLKRSGITEGDKIISGCLTALDKDNTKAGISYTFYKDVLGRFIAVDIPDDTSFLYGTYADFKTGDLGSGTLSYHLTGVDWSGKIVENHVLTYLGEDPMDGEAYNKQLPFTRKDLGSAAGGNSITPGINTGVMINDAGVVRDETDGVAMADNDKWTITSQDATRGFKEVEADGESWLLTNNTKFIVVSGHGLNDLKVTPYTGMSGLVGTGSKAVITKAALPADGAADKTLTGAMNSVYFKVKDFQYGTVGTDDNRTIETVILSDGNLTQYGVQTMYFAAPGAKATGVKLAGVTAKDNYVNQYELYKDGEKSTYFVYSDDKDGDTNGAAGADTVGTFYNLIPMKEISGVTVYKAEAMPAAEKISYTGVTNTGVTYQYYVVNDFGTARLKKGGEDTDVLAFNVGDAKVTDTVWKAGAAIDEITSVNGLNHAVSVGYKVGVAIVYDSFNVGHIYVTSITKA